MDLSLRRVEYDTEDYEYVVRLYDASFPKEEQDSMKRIMNVSKTSLGKLYVALDGETRVGLLYILMRKKLLFIHYLAVDPGMRGKGYGSAILTLIRESYPDYSLTLSIEAPDERAENNAERLARKSFYEKNGYRDTGRRTPWRGITYASMVSGVGEVRPNDVKKMLLLQLLYGL